MAEETKIDEFKLTGTEKDPLFPPGGGKDDSVVNVDRIFPPGGADAENLKGDDRLAQLVGQDELGQAGLEDVSVRGDIATDTPREKINAFRKAYPDGDLIFVTGTEAGIFTGADETTRAQAY